MGHLGSTWAQVRGSGSGSFLHVHTDRFQVLFPEISETLLLLVLQWIPVNMLNIAMEAFNHLIYDQLKHFIDILALLAPSRAVIWRGRGIGMFGALVSVDHCYCKEPFTLAFEAKTITSKQQLHHHLRVSSCLVSGLGSP